MYHNTAKIVLSTVLCFLIIQSCKEKENNKTLSTEKNKPNIVLLYVDDLGYADIGAYGATGVETPNLDKLSENGLKFTDAHSAAATCTPSRYALLTGNYAFRNKAKVLDGDAEMLIRPSQTTLPKMLQENGYTTGIVGKWHLGLGDGHLDYNTKVSPGPNEVGFNYSFLLPATGDRVPTVLMENGYVLNLEASDPIAVNYKEKIGDRPTGEEHPELRKQAADPQHNNTIVNGFSRIGYMAGGKKAEWVDEDLPFVFNQKAFQFLEKNADNPFFLFYSFHDIHVPRAPHDDFKGKSEMGPRGDAIVQVDYVVGKIVDKLKELSLEENTLIIFTSDNGPVLNDGYEDNAVELIGNHKPAGIYRGGKFSIYEGGTRVPTITYWPKTIQPGTSNALVNQVDLMASIAAMLDVNLNEEVLDSKDYWETWVGKSRKGRDYMIEESYTLALRDGDYKYIQPRSQQGYKWIEGKGIESGLIEDTQLYDLKKDPSETTNLAQSYPEKVIRYEKLIDSIINYKQ